MFPQFTITACHDPHTTGEGGEILLHPFHRAQGSRGGGWGSTLLSTEFRAWVPVAFSSMYVQDKLFRTRTREGVVSSASTFITCTLQG